MFMFWNGYPSFTRNSIIKQLKTFPKKVEKEKDDKKIRCIRLPYLGNTGDSIKKNWFKKVPKCLKENDCFITCYEKENSNVFFQLRIGFQYIKKQALSTKSLDLPWL